MREVVISYLVSNQRMKIALKENGEIFGVSEGIQKMTRTKVSSTCRRSVNSEKEEEENNNK